jgi:hypothetical protein
LAALLVVAAIGCGCTSNFLASKVPFDSAASLYDQARISYQIDAGKLQVPVSVARIEGQLVYYQEVPSSLTPNSTIGKLEIEYPHPRGLAGYALARVSIQSSYPERKPVADDAKSAINERLSETVSQLPLVGTFASSAAAEVDEIWELDVPRIELDRIVFDLNQEGYFGREAKSGPVAIRAKIDGHSVARSWERLSVLDRMMVEVRSHGRLISYKRTPGSDKLAGPPPASLAAYRDYAARDASTGQMADRYLAGGPSYPGVSADPHSRSSLHGGAIAAREAAARQRLSRLPRP